MKVNFSANLFTSCLRLSISFLKSFSATCLNNDNFFPISIHKLNVLTRKLPTFKNLFLLIHVLLMQVYQFLHHLDLLLIYHQILNFY